MSRRAGMWMSRRAVGCNVPSILQRIGGCRWHVAFGLHSATYHHQNAIDIERRRGMNIDHNSWPVDKHVRVASPAVPCVCARGVPQLVERVRCHTRDRTLGKDGPARCPGQSEGNVPSNCPLCAFASVGMSCSSTRVETGESAESGKRAVGRLIS